MDLTETFERVLDKSHADVDKITVRHCGSDRFDGIEYTFYGHYVPIRPIIDVLSEVEGYAIESMFHTSDGYLCVFVAKLPSYSQTHPAFI